MLAHSSASRRPARFLFIARYIVSVMYLYVSHVLSVCSVCTYIHTHTYAHAQKLCVTCIHIMNTTCLCILAKVTHIELFPPKFWWTSDRDKTRDTYFLYKIFATDMTNSYNVFGVILMIVAIATYQWIWRKKNLIYRFLFFLKTVNVKFIPYT